MKRPILLLFQVFLVSGILWIGCQPNSSTTSDDGTEDVPVVKEQEDQPIVLSQEGITLTEVVSTEFEGARLQLNATLQAATPAGGTVDFDFQVDNYELGGQTEDAPTKSCANSAKGQHIHLILNNEPYSAFYESVFSKELTHGNYMGLAFLSRSYHESIKTDEAYELFSFSIGEVEEAAAFDLSGVHMFYSRPKGSYVGDDIKKVLLDFYLVNADLSATGYKVKATINGTEFLLEKWVPYAMEGLPAGELTVELALLDATGQLVASPFNPVRRAVTLEE